MNVGHTQNSKNNTLKHALNLTTGQTALLFAVLGIGLKLFYETIQVGMFNTLLLFIFISITGLLLSRMLQYKLNDLKLSILGNIWLIKLSITIFLLYVGWIPQLDPNASSTWGYDPQRYYQDAFNLIGDNWKPKIVNYQGIIYYYAVVFLLFGHNPVAPMLVNAFVTLLGTLYLIDTIYKLIGKYSNNNWIVAFLLLIPEIVWYDVMTCRETLMATLIIIGTLSVSQYSIGFNSTKLVKTLLLAGISLFGILTVRTPMAIPVLTSITFIMILLKPQKRLKKKSAFPKLLILSLLLVLVVLGPAMQEEIGGYSFDYSEKINKAQKFEDNIASIEKWSVNSIGLLLAPNNPIESFIFLIPRMILYIIAPLPKIYIPLSDFVSGNWSAWQKLTSILTSIMYILVLPYSLAGLVYSLKKSSLHTAPLVFHIIFWNMFIAIGGGNIIIHERYRVMITLLLFTSSWAGYVVCTKRQVKTFMYLWISVLVFGALFYLSIKS